MLAVGTVLASPLRAGAQNPLAIPPLVEEDTFHLVVGQHTHEFYPGIHTMTYGVNAEYLGPTLLFHTGDTVHIQLRNELDTITSMHWHGMQVPGEMDGGPPREVQPGGTWDVKYLVKDPASTHWYHPHPHGLTAEQAHQGVAGFILVRDDHEATLDLPRTYGVDDIPLVLQDRRFDAEGQLVFGPFGDSVLVNGTPHAYVELPAQMVRLRLLNGSNARIYQVGFEDDRSFHIIANDGGLIESPIAVNRVRLSNGERSEVLVDLAGLEGDSLLLMSFGTELDETMPGGSQVLHEPSALNRVDFPLLRIRVVAPTADPVTGMPAVLTTLNPPSLADVVRTRHKALSGFGQAGNGMFMINGLMFDMDVVNDTITLGSTEIWSFLNGTDIAHPMHIHGGSFYVLDRDGNPPLPWEQGPKDVVLVGMGEQVNVIMRFDELTNGWPFMYHCHNLMHEDLMLMLQLMVIDPSTEVAPALAVEPGLHVFPSPATDRVGFRCAAPVEELVLLDVAGRRVREAAGSLGAEGTLPVGDLRAGVYRVVARSGQQRWQAAFVKE